MYITKEFGTFRGEGGVGSKYFHDLRGEERMRSQ